MSGICGVVCYRWRPRRSRSSTKRLQNRLLTAATAVLSIGFTARSAWHIWPHRRPPSHPSGLCAGDRLVVVADARLDNRAEMTHLLAAKGCQPAGAPTDLELILAAFACWGPACSERLQGAYSLACWNEADASLVLLRDRLGERPLYWCSTATSLFFASEPAQLLSVHSIDPAPNLERILAYLLKQPFDPTWSFFRSHPAPAGGAFSRLQGSPERLCSVIGQPQSVAQQAWRRLEAAEALSQSLEQAVARRLSNGWRDAVFCSAAASIRPALQRKQLPSWSAR